jgi:hypothetical protein
VAVPPSRASLANKQDPGAALSAGPVQIQPAAPEGTGQPARPTDDPALARLLAWLLGPRPEWPW